MLEFAILGSFSVDTKALTTEGLISDLKQFFVLINCKKKGTSDKILSFKKSSL